MKKFLVLYLGTEEGFAAYKKLEEAQRKANEKTGMEAWKKWTTDNAGSVVDNGSPIGKTKRIDKNGISDTKNGIGAYTVVQAGSLEDAAKLFVGHPHFTFFPGESVEVMECLPMPEM